MKAAMTAAVTKLIQLVKAALALKFDKAGGEISGNVKIGGNLTLDIPNEDYDAGITLSKTLDDNLGTVLQLQGYAHGEEQTWYRAVLRGVAEPSQNYDAANKKYVDDHTATPTLHLVDLNLDGSVRQKASSLVYQTIADNLTNPKREDYLDVFWENGQGTNSYTRFKARAVGISDVNTGDVMFEAEFYYLGIPIWIVFTLSPQSVLTTVAIIRRENTANKAQSIVANSQSAEKYPSTAAVFNEFERKPVVVWEVQDVTQGLLALNTNITANLAWQLTDLDLTPFSRIKIFAKAGRKTGATAADTSITPAVILEMSLDDRAKETVSRNVFIGSILFQNPNDANRLGSLTCAVSADKTKFAVTRATSLYGTAATSNTDTYQYVFKIEGFYE